MGGRECLIRQHLGEMSPVTKHCTTCPSHPTPSKKILGHPRVMAAVHGTNWLWGATETRRFGYSPWDSWPPHLSMQSPKHACLLVTVTWGTSLPTSHCICPFTCPAAGTAAGLRVQATAADSISRFSDERSRALLHARGSCLSTSLVTHRCAAFPGASLPAGLCGAGSPFDRRRCPSAPRW